MRLVERLPALRPLMLLAAACLAQACAQYLGPPAAGTAVPPIVGRVEFPVSLADRKTQATVGYVAVNAPVYLIHPQSKRAEASTIADGSGAFSLGFNSFVPETGVAYFLEAVKGLADHAAGHPAVRVRTLVEFRGGAWFSLAGAAMIISRSTTAMAVPVSLRDTNPQPLIGTLTPGVSDNSVLPPTPDSYAEVPGLTNAEFHAAFGMVDTALKLDQDPFNVIKLGQGGALLLAAAPTLNATPASGAHVGAEMTLSGGLFEQVASANQVLFNGIPATVSAVLNDGSELRVIVPAGATTGPITVTAGTLQYQVPFYLITPSLAVSVK